MNKLSLVLVAVVASLAIVSTAQAYEAGWTLYYTGVPTPTPTGTTSSTA